MRQPQGDQRPIIVKQVRLRWWGYTFVPIALLVWLGISGYLPVALAIFALFATVFWTLSLFTALFMLVTGRGRTRTEPPK